VEGKAPSIRDFGTRMTCVVKLTLWTWGSVSRRSRLQFVMEERVSAPAGIRELILLF